MDTFVKNLRTKGRAPYNTRTDDYDQKLLSLYKSVLKYKEACNVK